MTVAECGSISNASVVLSLTCSPVSRMLGEFESFYKEKLFERKGKSLILTPLGEKIHNELYPIYAELVKLEKNIKKPVRKNATIRLVHDWGKDALVYAIYEYLSKNSTYKKIQIESIDAATNGKDDCDTLYLLSREHYSPGNVLLNKFEGEQLCYVSHENNANHKTLLVSDEQLTNPVMSRAIYRLKVSGEEMNVIHVNNSSVLKELIVNCQGCGILPSSFRQLKSWSNLQFTMLPRREIGGFDSYVYVTSTLLEHDFIQTTLVSLIKRVSNLPG